MNEPTGSHLLRGFAVVFALLFAIVTGPLTAQGSSAQTEAIGEFVSHENVDEYADRMQLSDEQIVRFRPVMVDAYHAWSAVLEKHGVDLNSDRTPGIFTLLLLKFDVDSINDKVIDDLAPIMTPVQLKVLRDIIDENMTKWRNRLLN